jgi:hypothetical protein
VIVEYCRFGNLQTYLINHRNNFVNQVDELGNLFSDAEMQEKKTTEKTRSESDSSNPTVDDGHLTGELLSK